ncbi:MAG: hypothetical protein IJI88_00310 [Atopobiaceae bacterium]|nr:hypothetical protein [Olsenella sp.]MBQ6490697.1 hypothetical protein [Atopobiaceae bacterium]
MVKIRDLNQRQRRIYSACLNGWYLSGRYTASFDNHRRSFRADSPSILFRDVEAWYDSHRENHPEAHLLVKCEQAL